MRDFKNINIRKGFRFLRDGKISGKQGGPFAIFHEQEHGERVGIGGLRIPGGIQDRAVTFALNCTRSPCESSTIGIPISSGLCKGLADQSVLLHMRVPSHRHIDALGRSGLENLQKTARMILIGMRQKDCIGLQIARFQERRGRRLFQSCIDKIRLTLCAQHR